MVLEFTVDNIWFIADIVSENARSNVLIANEYEAERSLR
jgi:hypothetical protein